MFAAKIEATVQPELLAPPPRKFLYNGLIISGDGWSNCLRLVFAQPRHERCECHIQPDNTFRAAYLARAEPPKNLCGLSLVGFHPVLDSVSDRTVRAPGAHKAVRPAAGYQILLAGFIGGELRLELTQRLRKWRARHPPTLLLVVC
jgi:hypothetical protein